MSSSGHKYCMHETNRYQLLRKDTGLAFQKTMGIHNMLVACMQPYTYRYILEWYMWQMLCTSRNMNLVFKKHESNRCITIAYG